jgi:hypothetical protein
MVDWFLYHIPILSEGRKILQIDHLFVTGSFIEVQGNLFLYIFPKRKMGPKIGVNFKVV